MKKLKNHYLQNSRKYAQIHNAEGKVVFEGLLLKRYRVSEDYPLVLLLKDDEGLVHSFVNLDDEAAIVVGPVGITQAKALDNYLLFEKNGKWYGQYFNQDEEIDLGKPIELYGQSGIKSFLFYLPYVLVHADDNRLRCYDCLRYEKVKFINDLGEYLLVYGHKGKVFLFDDEGKFETEEPVLFCQKVSGEGLILRNIKSKKEYKIIYEGKFLEKYNIDEYYVKGEKRETETAIKNDWPSKDMFIVPDDDATSGTLYKIGKNKIQKLASGKLYFISKITPQEGAWPLDEDFVQVGDKTYQLY